MSNQKTNTMNEVGEKIDLKKAVCREMSIAEIHSVVAGSGINRAGSWGFHNGVETVKNKAYRFTVNGHHHKGHVHIVLNFMDTFDIYYTSNQGTIKKKSEGVYIDVLIETLDNEIERIDDYVR